MQLAKVVISPVKGIVIAALSARKGALVGGRRAGKSDVRL